MTASDDLRDRRGSRPGRGQFRDQALDRRGGDRRQFQVTDRGQNVLVEADAVIMLRGWPDRQRLTPPGRPRRDGFGVGVGRAGLVQSLDDLRLGQPPALRVYRLPLWGSSDDTPTHPPLASFVKEDRPRPASAAVLFLLRHDDLTSSLG